MIRFQRGASGGTQNRNTAQKIGKHRNTPAKIDGIPKQHYRKTLCPPPPYPTIFQN